MKFSHLFPGFMLRTSCKRTFHRVFFDQNLFHHSCFYSILDRTIRCPWFPHVHFLLLAFLMRYVMCSMSPYLRCLVTCSLATCIWFVVFPGSPRSPSQRTIFISLCSDIASRSPPRPGVPAGLHFNEHKFYAYILGVAVSRSSLLMTDFQSLAIKEVFLHMSHGRADGFLTVHLI